MVFVTILTGGGGSSVVEDLVYLMRNLLGHALNRSNTQEWSLHLLMMTMSVSLQYRTSLHHPHPLKKDYKRGYNMSKSNDGKYLEDAVEEELKKIRGENFRYRRLPDARTARGMFPAQPADYFLSYSDPDFQFKRGFHLECKSVKGKTRRLPKFTQHAEMIAWSKAGVLGYVIVHFHETEEIFVVSVNDIPIGKPSWVLEDGVNSTQVATIKEALVDFLYMVETL